MGLVALICCEKFHWERVVGGGLAFSWRSTSSPSARSRHTRSPETSGCLATSPGLRTFVFMGALCRAAEASFKATINYRGGQGISRPIARGQLLNRVHQEVDRLRRLRVHPAR